MGVYREFSFKEDSELLSLKYQLDNGNFIDHFNEDKKEEITKQVKENEIQRNRHQL